MSNTYTLTTDGKHAIRSSDGAAVPWDSGNDRPLDITGLAGQIWVADGSPVSLAFVAPPPPFPEVISRRQFFTQAAILGLISQSEALAAVQTGEIPILLQTIINGLPTAQQFPAQMTIAGASDFLRHDALTIQFGAALSWTDAQLDSFWTAATAL